jgi:solute carrier family 25 2-oxodicarboxylate transporter 21
MVEAPKRAIKFTANDEFKRLYSSMGFTDGTAMSVATGMSAGVIESFIVTEFELVKIRLQDKANVLLWIELTVAGEIQEHVLLCH